MCMTLINFQNIPETKWVVGVQIQLWAKEREIDAWWENNRLVSGSSVVICVVFYWETLVPIIQVEGTVMYHLP